MYLCIVLIAIDCFTLTHKDNEKLVFMFVALAAISFASCGNKAEAPATTDSTSVDSTANDSTANDSAATDSAATPAAATDSVAK